MIKLYGLGLSLYVRKTRFVLEHKELDYSLIELFPHNDDPVFKANSPLGKIPLLIDGDFAVCDSSVIYQYLEQQYPETALANTSAQQRATALWLEEYSDTRVSEILSGLYFQKFFVVNILGDEPDSGAIEEKEQAVDGIFDYLESRLKDKPYIAGATLSIADFSLASNFANFFSVGYEIDSSRWPGLAEYSQRLLNLPAVLKVLAAEEVETANFLESQKDAQK